MYLVHFRSKELAKLRPYGRFWHVLFPSGGFMVDQDEEDTFTCHLPIYDLHTDVSKIDPREAAYECLGGTVGPFRFEVLVHSAWRPNFCIAEKYKSDGGRVLLVGDSGQYFTQFV
jgi:FAD-dependent monooxygenase